MHNIEKNLARVRQQIIDSCRQYNRAPEEVTLLAVSKTRPASELEQAIECGQLAFGESYLQEAQEKINALQGQPVQWHYIGPIQSNKTQRISELFDWVHSVDRLKVASKLDEFRPPDKDPLNVLLQVNIDNEATKSGISLDEIIPLAQHIEALNRLKLRGLMAIPAPRDSLEAQRRPLARMHEALLELQQYHPDCDTLSMGMTADMQAAIAEGSTLVRIGTAIFGPRLT